MLNSNNNKLKLFKMFKLELNKLMQLQWHKFRLKQKHKHKLKPKHNSMHNNNNKFKFKNRLSNNHKEKLIFKLLIAQILIKLPQLQPPPNYFYNKINHLKK